MSRRVLYPTIIALMILFYGSWIGYEYYDRKSCVPPSDVKTAGEVMVWLGERYAGVGEYQNGGKTYKVILRRSNATLLRSGPAGYVIDGENLIDYTVDIGDDNTARLHWNLRSGNVKIIEWH